MGLVFTEEAPVTEGIRFLPIPTPEQEALQAPGQGENLLVQLVDPGVLLDPANLAAGAGAGVSQAANAGTSLLKGAATGLSYAATGLAGLAGMGVKGLAQGIRRGLSGEAERAVPEAVSTVTETAAPQEGIRFTEPEAPLSTQLPIERVDEALPKYAGSVNLPRISTDDDAKQAILSASKLIPKRETISLDDVQASAAKLGYGLADAEQLAATTPTQRAGIVAARNVHAALAERYEGARQAYVAAQTPENFDVLRKSEAEFLRGFKATQQLASEAGLQLRTFGLQAKADYRTQAERTVTQLLSQLQTKGQMSDEVTQRLAMIDKNDPSQMAQLIKDLSTKVAPLKDKLYEAFLNSILSGPQTHAANITGNLANLSLRPFDRIGSAAVDLMRAPIAGGARERFAVEGPLDLWGMTSALPDASRAFLASARNGFVTYGSKLETVRGAKIGGVTGEVIRTPTKLLEATDEFFKALSAGGTRYVTAYREAAKDGATGAARFQVMTAKLAAPSEAMQEAMSAEALRATFQQDLGKWGKAAIRFRNEIEPLRYVMPFIKTPINIAKEGLGRTPLGWLSTASDALKGQLPSGGALSDDLSKKLIGTGLSAWIATEVVAQNITGGGPPDPDMKRALLDTGWKPYSVKINGTFYPYNRLEPIATWMGTVADAVETMDMASESEQAEIVQKLSQGAAKNLVDKTYLQGMAEMGDALHDPGKYGEKFVAARLSAVVPSVLAQGVKAADHEMREVKGLLSTIQSRLPAIPGVTEGRQGLNPKRNLYGEPIEEAGGFWARYLSPSVPSPESGTPGQIAIVEAGADLGRMNNRLTVGDKTIKLDADQFDRLQVVAGQHVKQLVEPMAASAGFVRLPKEQRIKLLEEAVRTGREIGRKQYLAELLNLDRTVLAR
jgi:hypothetical protein